MSCTAIATELPRVRSVGMFIDGKEYLYGSFDDKLITNLTQSASKTSLRGSYFGSGTRINEAGTIWSPRTGYQDKHIRIVEVNHDSTETVVFDGILNLMEFSLKLLLKEKDMLAKHHETPEQIEEYNAFYEEKIKKICSHEDCLINDFSTFEIPVGESVIIFGFRQLHRFGDDIEISYVKY